MVKEIPLINSKWKFDPPTSMVANFDFALSLVCMRKERKRRRNELAKLRRRNECIIWRFLLSVYEVLSV